MLSVRLSQLPEGGQAFAKELRADPDDLGLSEAFAKEPVSVKLSLNRAMDRVYGIFELEAGLKLDCARCLKTFDRRVTTRFSVAFMPLADEGGRPKDDVDEDHDETVFFTGDELPLKEELRQELELQVPFTAFCRPDCPGLCQRCGHDLNTGACEHVHH